MMNKQYDWFATRIFQPELSLDELFDQGITPENTGFKTRDDYRNMASVRDQFRTEDGGFDEDAFNNAYNSSREMYNLYTNREYSKKLLEEFAYDPYEWYAPATGEIIDVSASNTPTNNGMFYSTNIAGIGENTESPYSVREIAQKQLVYDENGNQLDWTPEDKGGLLKGFFRDPLVLATYDEDTPEYDEAGNLLAIHKKGEYKLNEWGAPYYEMLGDRDAYGKEMLHYTDTFTKEGTVLNKLDFYDSDGKRKSVFGTAMRTASQILPMFLHPVVGYTWGALNAAKGIGQSMAALSKGIDSIITGEDDNEFGRTMTKMENWLARFDNSKSDYGQTHMWASAETYGDLIGSTTKQLFEQRLIANIPKQLKFLGTNIERSKMGQNMAIAYMAATSAKESYQAGIEAGLGDRQAGLLLLANTAAMWKLMDSDYGRSTLFRGSWFDDDLGRKTAKETADFMVKSTDKGYAMEEINKKMADYGSTRLVKATTKIDDAAKGLGKAANKAAQQQAKNAGKEMAEEAVEGAAKNAAKNAGTEAAAQAGNELAERTRWETSKEFLKKAYNQFSKSFKEKLEVFRGVEPEEYLSAMLREGVEEVAEEAIMDATKATTLALEALGVKMNDTGQKLDYGFSGKDLFDRYLLSFIGGAVGGGIFRGYSAYEQYRDKGKIDLPDYQRELIDMVAKGRGDEIIAEYKRLYDKGLLGSTELKSSFKMSSQDDADVTSEGEMSQADANLRILIGNVRYIEQVLKDEGLFDAIKQSKEANIVTARNLIWNSEGSEYLTENEKRGRFLMLHSIGAHQLMTHDFIKLGEEFVDAKIWRDALIGDLEKKDGLTETEKDTIESVKKAYESRVKELRQRRDDILDGKYNGEYASSILLETDGILPKVLQAGKLSKDSWAMSQYGRLYSALDPLRQRQVDKDIELYENEVANYYGRNFANTHDGTKRMFLALQRRLRPDFEEQNEALKDKKVSEFHTDNYFGEQFFQSIVKYQEDLNKAKALKIRRDELSQNLTPENQTIIDKLDEEIAKIEARLSNYVQQYNQYRYIDGEQANGDNTQNLTPMNMLLQNFKGKDETFNKLIDTYDAVVRSPDINEYTADLLGQILSIYNTIKKDGGLVQDMGELKMAEQAMIKFIDNWTRGKFMFPEHINISLRDVSPNIQVTDPKTKKTIHIQDTLLGSDPERKGIEKRKLFEEKILEVKKHLQNGDYSAAKTSYDVAKSLVLETMKIVESDDFWLKDVDTMSPSGFGLSADETDFTHEFAIQYFKKAFYFPNLAIGDEDLENPFDLFFDIVETTSTLDTTPFTKLLRAFKSKVDGEDTVVDYLNGFFNKYVSSNNWVDFFIASTTEQDALKDLMKVVDLMEIMLSMDNKTVEAMNTFYEEGDKLTVFNPISRRNLLRDLDAIRSKIFIVYENGRYNSRNRHSEIEKDFKRQTVNNVQNLLKFWGDIDDERKDKEFDISAIWEEAIQNHSLADSLLKKETFKGIDTGTLTDSQFKEIYNVVRRFESLVYKKWESIKEKDFQKNAERFIKLFEGSESFKSILLGELDNPYDVHSSGAITPVETFEYLLTLVSVDGIELDKAYRQALESFRPSDSKIPAIPNDEQESATKFAAAYLSNPKFWSAVQSTLQSRIEGFTFDESDKELADLIKHHKILNNTIIIPGACGVGKTTMVGLILKQLWQGERQTLINAPKSKTAESLANTFGGGSNYVIIGQSEEGKEVDGKEELFKFLFGETATNKFEFTSENKILKIKDLSKYPFLKLSEEKIKELKKYEVLIIDEIGQYNEVELQLIDAVAQQAGFYIIGLGDHCQMGDIVDIDGLGNSNSNYQDVRVWKTPYLIRSMRNTSIAKGANNARLGKNIYTIENARSKTDEMVSTEIMNQSVSGIDIETTLKYSVLLESGFCGDRITSSEEDFNEVVEHLLNTKRPNDTISIVIDDADGDNTKRTQWEQRLKKLEIENWEKIFIIKNINKNEINGYETAYTIVDIDWGKRLAKYNAKTIWKDFYTISQRSHLGTIFFDKTDSLKKVHILSELDPEGHYIWNNDSSFVKQWFDSRMSLFTSGSAVLFNNPESAFPINHSIGEEEKEAIKDIPTFEEILKEESEESKSEESGESVEEAKERKKEHEAEEIRIATNEITKNIEEVEKHLHESKIKIDGDSVVSETLGNLDAMTLDECNEFLTKINELLKEINEINKQVNSSKSEVKTAVDDKVKTLNKFEKFLKDSVNTITAKIAEIVKTQSIEKTEESIDRSISEIMADIKAISVDDALKAKVEVENIIAKIENVKTLLTKEVIDALLAKGKDVKKKVDDAVNLLNTRSKEIDDLINEKNTKFNDYVKTINEDEIEGLSSYSDLSNEEKEKVISEIQEAIDGYNNAITGLDVFKDEPILQDSVAHQKVVWRSRIYELKILSAELKKTLNPVSPIEGNLEALNKLSKDASEAWKSVKKAIIGPDVLRNAISASQQVVTAANTLLNEALTETQKAALQKLIEYHEEQIANNQELLERIENETEYDDEGTVLTTKGFDVNQKFGEGYELDFDETKRILQEHDSTLNAEQVVSKLFSGIGTKQYMQLRKDTDKGKKVIMWGLDLETTGKDARSAQIVQIGLVKYEVSRNGENWKIEVVKGSEIDKFVIPAKEGLTPPAKFDDGEPNPIYEPWKDTPDSDKLTEKRALEIIFNTIGTKDYVITYNGASYDLNVLKARASALGVSGAVNENMHIDVYADFVGSSFMHKIRGYNLLWNSVKTTDASGKEVTVREPIGSFPDRKLSTIAEPIFRTLPSDLPAHNAVADVHMTADVLINMFNGVSTYIGRQSVVSSGYHEKGVGDDLYLSEVLIPHVEKWETEGKLGEMSKMAATEALIKIRHRILKGDSEISYGKKVWEYDSTKDRSILVYKDELSKYDGLPLLAVKGKRSGEYKGSFEYQDAKFSMDAMEDIDLLELRRRYPTLRFSKPFVLTGVRHDKLISLEKLNKRAKEFYDPETGKGNLGKTYVLVTSDPTFEDNWDPSEALVPITKNGELHWRNPDFKMLTVSRDANLQDMIDFSIASCALATDYVAGKEYMEKFFEGWKNKIRAIKTKISSAETKAAKDKAEKELENVLMIAGITLSRTQYEKLLKDTTVGRAKLFFSDVFSVMYSKNVGKFLASFINACTLHSDEVTNVLSARAGQSLPKDKSLHQWILDNLIETLRRESYQKNWNSKDRYCSYYTLDLTIKGIDFKIVHSSDSNKTYLFQGNVDIQTQINKVDSSVGTLSLDKDGLVFSGDNTRVDIINALEAKFGAQFGEHLKFDKIELNSTSSPRDSEEIRQYPVSANEVFTRAFTTWTNEGNIPAGLKGWNDVYEIIRQEMDGYEHGIYGHEIVDRSSNDAMDSSIFSASICNNSLNGEYKARTAKLTQYGGWVVKDDVSEVDLFKEKITKFVSAIGKLGGEEFKKQFESQIDVLAQNANNRNLDDSVIKNYLVSEANKLMRQLNEKSLVETVFFVNTMGEFEANNTFRNNPELLTKMGYNLDYYFTTSDQKTKVFIQFKNDEPVAFCIENVDGTKSKIDLIKGDLKSSLFKNILLSLWNKEISISQNQKGNFIRYYLQQYLNEENSLSDLIISAVRNHIIFLDQQGIDIFSDEIVNGMVNNFEVFKEIVVDDKDLYESFKELVLDFGIHEALDLIGFNPFGIFKKIC